MQLLLYDIFKFRLAIVASSVTDDRSIYYKSIIYTVIYVPVTLVVYFVRGCTRKIYTVLRGLHVVTCNLEYYNNIAIPY